MDSLIDEIPFPELVFGIVGPIGVDIDLINETLCNSLSRYKYNSHSIQLTKELFAWLKADEPTNGDYKELIDAKIEFANTARSDRGDAAYLAQVAIRAIRKERTQITGNALKIPQDGRAYIVRQLKRPEEVDLLRQVYGRKFIVVSAYGAESERIRITSRRIQASSDNHIEENEANFKAEKLIQRDAEESVAFGQRLRDTFHLGDVFIDGINKPRMEENIDRFVDALFGRNDISPSKDEYGMYAAKSASLRSADLSRQVGAAIFSEEGEIITQGCNEAPKAFGGTYWDLEEPDFRDVRIGSDPNESQKREIVKDFIQRLRDGGYLSEKATSLGTPAAIAEALTKKASRSDDKETDAGPLHGALVLDLTEYGRIVHAEMCAICDAARLGKSVRGATLFCTTFPCHNCTKHIVASGIRRVVYMEPYPKSRAKELYENEIVIERSSTTRVSFVPFLGISPYRYRDIFQKGKRKSQDGAAKRWYGGEPKPMVKHIAPLHLDLEAKALTTYLTETQAAKPTPKRRKRKRA